MAALPKFSDEDLEAITCESSWRRGSVETASSSCQTRDLETTDVGVTSIETYDVACQTKPPSDNTIYEGRFSEDFVECLLRAAATMCDELSKSQTKAFTNYQVLWEDELDSVTCSLTLNEPNSEKYTDMPVTGLSWNCTGSVLAASYGHIDHDDWCSHKARICMWNVDRHEKTAKKPDNLIDLDSCVMCLKFHPHIPGLIAGGTFSGDVVIWDLAKDSESNLLISDSQQESHGDSVSEVHWLVEKRKNSVVSITSSGRVDLWTVEKKGTVLSFEKSSLIQTDHIIRLKSESIACSVAAFDPSDNFAFLLGTETGGIYKCTRDVDHVKANLAYKGHNGPIYGLEFSKLNRNTFLTCGTDSCINIYSTLQESPLLSLEPCQGYLYSCRWSPVIPSVIAVGGSRGKVVFYDLNASHLTPCHVLDCCEKSTPVQAVEFNPHHVNLLASGDAKGQLKVWTLGSDLTTSADGSAFIEGLMIEGRE